MALLLLAFNSMAQQRIVLNMNEYIDVHVGSDEDECFCQLLPLEKLPDDYVYDAIILDQTFNRYKLQITMRMIDGPESQPIIGWVNKNQCGAFLLCNNYSGSTPLLFLYKFPELDSEFTVVELNQQINGQWISIRDIQKGFALVSFKLNDILYSGWIQRFCTDPYNSCN